MDQTTNAFVLTRRIGNTLYRTRAFFSPEATETLQEKIIRMVRSESMDFGGNCGIMTPTPQLSRQSERSAV